MNNYFYDKSKMYYERFKNGKLTKKVGSIIKRKNKYLTIITKGKKPCFPGGSVEEGESTRQAITREVFEETGVKVVSLKYLNKKYYSVEWEYNGVKFPNKRVEYTYLCEIEGDDFSICGLEGEFEEKTSLKWCTYVELEYMGLWAPTLELIKKIENEEI